MDGSRRFLSFPTKRSSHFLATNTGRSHYRETCGRPWWKGRAMFFFFNPRSGFQADGAKLAEGGVQERTTPDPFCPLHWFWGSKQPRKRRSTGSQRTGSPGKDRPWKEVRWRTTNLCNELPDRVHKQAWRQDKHEDRLVLFWFFVLRVETTWVFGRSGANLYRCLVSLFF